MATSPQIPDSKKDSSLGKIGPVSVSLLLHIALMLVIGSAVIIEQVIPKSSFKPAVLGESFDQQIEAETAPVEELQDPSNSQSLDLPADSVSMPESTSVESSIDAISVDSSLTASSWVISSGSNTGTPGISGVKGGGGTPGGTGTGKKTVGNIFGKQVEASKLGVILDVSGSAHDFLMPAMKEIEKSFENSPTVLAMGCGMGKITRGASEIEVYGKLDADDEKKKHKSGYERTSLGQLANAIAKIKGIEKFLESLKKRDDVYAIQGGDTLATSLGFEKLIAEGCDTIYWFADFQDVINAEVMSAVLKELKQKGIKVIAHDFTAKGTGQGWASATKAAEETGGDSIKKVP